MRNFSWALAAVGLALAVNASAQTVLRVVPHADLQNVDPIWTTAYITRNHGYMVYDTLFALDENFTPQPQMVDTHTVSDDGLTYTFTLRDGLLWHDGSPVTAADCVASIQRWGQRDGMGQQLLGVTESLTAVDDKTIELVLTKPYGLVLDSLGKISSNVPFMMPKHLAETDPFEQVPEIIGSGPYKFVKEEWVPGSKVVYVKNEDYAPRDEPPSAAAGGKVAKVDRVEWLYIPDHQTAMSALASGEVDIYERPPHDLATVMATMPGVQVEVFDPLGSQGMLRMNHLHPPFDKPEVRQAVLKLIDQETYMMATVGNPEFFEVCHTLFACGAPLQTDVGFESFKERDVEAAKAAIEEAGYAGHKVVVMHPTDQPINGPATLVTAQSLREVGFDVEVQAMDWSTLTSRRAMREAPEDGGWNVFHTWWIGADIANPVSNIGLSAGGAEKAWFGWPDDEELETLRAQFATETDPDKQREIAEAVQQRALEVVTHGNYGTFYTPMAFRDNLEGLITSPVPFFWNISK